MYKEMRECDAKGGGEQVISSISPTCKGEIRRRGNNVLFHIDDLDLEVTGD